MLHDLRGRLETYKSLKKRRKSVTTVIELLKQGRRDEVWNKCCGFIDLSLKEFMGIQERLLIE